MDNRFRRAVQSQRRATQQHENLIPGVLGIYTNGQFVVEVPTRNSFVYVRLRDNQNEVIQAFNSEVSPAYSLPVLVKWVGNRYEIEGRDTLRYMDWQNFSAYLPRHANTHEFNPEAGGGGDIVFVFPRQFMPMLAMPSGSVGSPGIIVNEYLYQNGSGGHTHFPPQGTVNLTVWNPTGSASAVMVLISLDSVNGSLVYTVGSGSYFAAGLTGTHDITPFIPTAPDPYRYFPVAAIRLVSGTSVISWDNIYDVRQHLHIFSTGAAGGGGAGSGTGGTTGNFDTTYLKLDTTNGPLYGPLVVYKANPNTQNQYLDYSTLVSYLSGTNDSNFAAGLESVGWSTGSQSYGLFIDDHGLGGGSEYIGHIARMDTVTFEISHNNYKDEFTGPKHYNNPTFKITRWGGIDSRSNYLAAAILVNQIKTNDAGPGLEIQANTDRKAVLWPTFTGTPFLFPFPIAAPYHFDTANTLKTGSVLLEVLHNTRAKFWIGISGEVSAEASFNIPQGSTYNIAGSPHVHSNILFPSPVFGVAGQDEGIALGTGTTINFRGESVIATISGTVIDVFLTGTAGAQGPAGAGNPGIMLWDEGIPQNTGTVINFVGPNVTATISGSVIDVSIPGAANKYGLLAYYVASGTNDITKTTATWQTMSGCTVVANILGTLVRVRFDTGAGNNTNSAVNRYRIAIDGIAASAEMVVRIPAASVGSPVSVFTEQLVTPGTHTFEGQWKVDNGTGQGRGSPTGTYNEPRYLFVEDYGI